MLSMLADFCGTIPSFFLYLVSGCILANESLRARFGIPEIPERSLGLLDCGSGELIIYFKYNILARPAIYIPSKARDGL